MKRILALVLAVMMLGSVTAFAASGDAAEVQHFEKVDEKSAKQETDVWLQVEAAGQIDATVPLVVVFKTNIDGGKASAPTNYAIVNHSTANLAVVEIAAQAQGDVMGLVDYDATANLNDAAYKDKYMVQLAAGSGSWDLNKGPHKGNPVEGGLFEVLIDDADGTPITLDMSTGRLSFITGHVKDGEDQKLDETQGLKILQITYKVAISTKTGLEGGDIGGTKNVTTYEQATDGTYTEKTEAYPYDYPEA